jgi:hypothetical protein
MKTSTGADRKVCVQSWAKSWAKPEAGRLTDESVAYLRTVDLATKLRAALCSLPETRPGFYVCLACAGERKRSGAVCPSCDGAGRIPLSRMVDTLLDLVVTGAQR